MATVQSVGGAPGIDPQGLSDLFKTGMLMQQQDKERQQNKKQGNDDIIKSGLSSKTMRPAKDGEKSDFSDSSGRGWVYDDSNLKEERSQLDNQRKDAHWITINSNVEKELQQAINSGQVDGTNQNAVNMFRNQRISQYLGIGPDGKMSSELKDDLSPEGQSWVDSLTKGSSVKPITTAPAQTSAVKPGLFASLAGMLNSPGTPGRSYNPSPNVPDPILGPMFTGPVPGGGMAGNNRMPGQQTDPQMAALMAIMAMHNGMGAPPQMPASNPYAINGTVPAGPVNLTQQGQ